MRTMRGVLIAGTGPGAGEAAVGAGARQVVVGAAEAAGTAAPPAIAGRHAGAPLAPEAVVAEVRAAAADGEAAVAVVTQGGLMAPLTERYLNRDLAVELRLPVVLAVPAGPGLMNAALLAVDAVRGAGLAVATIVITGWPDEPGRVLLDERKLLSGYTTVPVVTLELGMVPAIDEWIEAAPDDGGGGAPVALDPYAAWEERPVGDPRDTSRAVIMGVILEIVAAEGPLRASRAYSLYNRA